MTRKTLVWGAVVVTAPYVILLAPAGARDAILGSWIFVAFGAAVVTWTLTGVINLAHWLRGRHERSEAVQRTLEEMGYAATRNAKQQMGGRK